MKYSAYARSRRAFTLVEVLVVIVVLGILASVTYLSYGNYRNRVAKAETTNDLKGVSSAMESARNWSETGYPDIEDGHEFNGVHTDTKNIFVQSENVKLTYQDGEKDEYCIDAVSTVRPDIVMYLEVDDDSIGEPQEGLCDD